MSAYLIVFADIYNRPAFGAYVQALPPVFQRYQGQYLAVAAPHQVQCIGSAQRQCSMVVSHWPSMQRLREFWFSDAYQEVAKLRANTGQFDVCAVPALANPDSTSTMVLLSLTDQAGDLPSTTEIPALAQAETELLEGQRIATYLQLRLVHNVECSLTNDGTANANWAEALASNLTHYLLPRMPTAVRT